MKIHQNFFTLLLLAVLMLPAGTAVADAAKVLGDAGLTRNKDVYIVALEADLIAQHKQITQALREHKKAEDGFKKDQRKIDKAESDLAGMQREIDRLRKLINEADNHHIQDRYLPKYNELIKERDAGKEELEAYEQKHRLDSAAARAAFIEKLLAWVEQADAVQAKYDALAQDEKVTAAIKAAGDQDNKKYTLGPSTACQSVLRELERAQKTYQVAAVPLRKDGKHWLFDVQINGKPAVAMRCDPLDQHTIIPGSLAKALGIEAKAKAPTTKIQFVGQGRNEIVELKHVVLGRVQVGEHEARDVLILVAPEGVEGVPARLGRSFFDHFAYKVDADAQRVILGQLK